MIPGLQEIKARIDADNEQAQKIVRVFDALGFSADLVGVKQWDNGNWHIGYEARPTLHGAALAIIFALHKTPEEIRDVFMKMADAMGAMKTINVLTAEPGTAAVSASA